MRDGFEFWFGFAFALASERANDLSMWAQRAQLQLRPLSQFAMIDCGRSAGWLAGGRSAPTGRAEPQAKCANQLGQIIGQLGGRHFRRRRRVAASLFE